MVSTVNITVVTITPNCILQEAHVVCQQLGYEDGAVYTQVGESKIADFQNLNSIDLLMNIQCRGDESDLSHCHFNQSGQTCNRNLNAMSIVCNR